MSDQMENRALGRIGARLLTEEELKDVNGGFPSADVPLIPRPAPWMESVLRFHGARCRPQQTSFLV
jgi:hypothetical protein